MSQNEIGLVFGVPLFEGDTCMKTSLSKILLSGVLATSFMLINCQKAPSRGVKAKAGTDSSQTDAANKTTAETPKKTVECSPGAKDAIAEAQTKLDELKKLYADKNKTDITSADSDDLVNKADNLKTKTDTAVKSIEDLKADACYNLDANKKQLPAVAIETIKYNSNDIIAKVQTLTKKSTPQTEAAVQEKTVADATRVKTLFKNQEVLYVREALANVLDSEHTDGEVYFIDGELYEGKTDYEAALDKKSQTVCMIEAADSEKPAKNTKLVIQTPTETAATKLKSATLKVSLRSDSYFYRIFCQIAEGKESQKELEFLTALGKKHLMTKTQFSKLTDEDKVDDKAKKLKKYKKVVDEKKTVLDSKNETLKTAKEKTEKAKIDLEAAIKIETTLNADSSTTEEKKKAAKTAKDLAQTKRDEAVKEQTKAADAVETAQKEYDKAVKDKNDVAE